MGQIKNTGYKNMVINLSCTICYLYAKRPVGKKYIKMSKVIGEHF